MNIVRRTRASALLAFIMIIGLLAPLLTPPPVQAATTSPIKWHPGHYAALDGILRDNNRETLMAQHQTHIAELANEPTIKGVKIFVQWSAAEGSTAGDYTEGKAMIQQYIDWVSAAGKQLWISFLDVQFGGYGTNLTEFFPAYIVNGSQYGTTPMTNGIVARIWQQDTMDRVIARTESYGATFNSSPWVEGMQIEETSVAVTGGANGYSVANLITQFKRHYTAARAAWPNTAVRLLANYMGSDTQMADMIAHCADLGCAIGGPDVIPSESIQGNRIFTGQTGGIDYRNVLPSATEVQSPSLGGHEGTWTPAEIYNHAMYGTETIRGTQPRYFFWMRNTWSGGDAQKWSTGILPFIQSINGAVYSTACPTGYTAGCDTGSGTPGGIKADQVANGVVTVDGALTEGAWKQGGSDLPFTLNKVVAGTWNNTVRYSTLWSPTYLYVAVKVTDASLYNDSTPVYDDDSIDVYVDGNHNHGAYDSADNYYQKGWNDSAISAKNGVTSGVLHAWQAITGGYQIEMAIPWANLGVTPAVGAKIGLDIASSDDDNGGTRDGQAMAFGTTNNWQDTTAFGDVTLGGPGFAANKVASGVVTVDGALSEGAWNQGGSDLPFNLNKVVTGTWNNTVRYSTLWSPTYLYVAVKVTDASLQNDSTPVYDDDSIDVYVDGNHNHGAYDSADNYYQKGWNDSAISAKNGVTSGVLHAWQAITGGYQIEMAIPWANLGVTPAVGAIIGLDIANSDDDNGTGRDGQAMAFGTTNNWLDTSAFGDLRLLDTP